MEEESPEVEAEIEETPQAEEPIAESGSGSGKSKALLIGGGVVVALLLIAGLLLPPISLLDRLSGGDGTETAESEEAVPTEEGMAEGGSAITGEVEVMSASPVAVASVPMAELASVGVNPLPQHVLLQGNVYTVDTNGTAVDGQVAINVPAGVDAQMLDMYAWNGAGWEFIPSGFDAATQQRISPDLTLRSAYALGETQAPMPKTTAGELHQGQTLPEAIVPYMSDVTVGALTLVGNGDLQGNVTAVPAGNFNQYIWVTNVGAVTDQASLAAFLGDTTAQMNQVNALVNTAVTGNFAGINLDYQGVDPSQGAAFTGFIQSLADALHAQGKRLIVTLGTPQNINGEWDTAGQDWAAIGAIADSVYALLPLDPTAYSEGGEADQMLDWATDQVDRSKMVALTHASAVDRLGESFIELPNEQALTNFGQMEFTAGGPEIEPGTAVEVALSGSASPLEWDGESLTYRYSYEDNNGQQHFVWLGNPAATVNRLNTAVAHKLQGVAVRGLGQVNDPAGFAAAMANLAGQGEVPQPTGAAIVWTILDEAESILASDSGNNMTFAWEGSPEPGDFAVNVDFAFGDAVTSLGTSPIVVGTAEPEEVIEEEPEEETGTASVGDADGVVNQNANVRVGPGLAYGIITGGLNQGTEVGVLGRSEDFLWINILFPDGNQEGWIFHTLLDLNPGISISDLEVVTDIAVAPSGGDSTGSTAPAAPPPVSAAPIAAGSLELGGQTHTFANPQLMSSAGMNWVKFQHKWGSGSNPGDLAGRINNAHGAGFKVLLSIPGANTYPDSIPFEEYVQFLGGVAALGPDAIEVWNEMNIDFEWPAGQIDPNSYVTNMLAPAYNAIKAANPNVMVISGAPAPTGFDNNTNAWADSRYMAGMAAAGAGNYLDCVGAHYNAGATSPSQNSGHPTGSAHYSWYLIPTMNVYAQLGKPVCFTELGYLSGDDYGGVPSRFSWASDTSIAEHAAWLAEAVSVLGGTGKVRMVIVFNVDFTHWSDDPQAGYAMIRKDGSCPACGTLAQVMGR